MFAPGLALNFLLAKREFEIKGTSSRMIPIRVPELENPGLMLNIARFFVKSMRFREALEIYSLLLDRRLAPDFSREEILHEACDLARSRNDSSCLSAWLPELERLSLKNTKKK